MKEFTVYFDNVPYSDITRFSFPFHAIMEFSRNWKTSATSLQLVELFSFDDSHLLLFKFLVPDVH